MKQPIQIMLVEDHPEYRESLTLALSKETDMQVAGQFGTAEQALRHVQSLPPVEQPDLVLLDLNLPSMSGLEALPWLQQYAPKVKIIILSAVRSGSRCARSHLRRSLWLLTKGDETEGALNSHSRRPWWATHQSTPVSPNLYSIKYKHPRRRNPSKWRSQIVRSKRSFC